MNKKLIYRIAKKTKVNPFIETIADSLENAGVTVTPHAIGLVYLQLLSKMFDHIEEAIEKLTEDKKLRPKW